MSNQPKLTPFGNPMPPPLTAEQKAWADQSFARTAEMLQVYYANHLRYPDLIDSGS